MLKGSVVLLGKVSDFPVLRRGCINLFRNLTHKDNLDELKREQVLQNTIN